MTYYTHHVSQPSVDRVHHGGREYLSFPAIPIRAMVYNYPEEGTRELLPAAHIAESVDHWAGTPVTPVHPPDRGNGQTVRTPEAFLGENIGEAHEPELVQGGEKLRVNIMVDVEKANSIGGLAAEVVDLLDSGEELAISPGYGTVGDDPTPGSHNGQPYDLVQGVPVPDHIAIFPADKFNARCSPEEGCAAPRLHAEPPIGPGESAMGTNDESASTRFWSGLFDLVGADPGEVDITVNGDDDEEADTSADETSEAGEGHDCSEGPCSCGEHTDETGEEQTDDDEPSAEEGASDDDETEMTDEETETEAETEGEEQSPPEEEAETKEEQTDEESETIEIRTEDLDELVAERVEAKLDDAAEQLKANYEAEVEHEANARIVANAKDIPVEAAESMDEETLAELAEEVGGEPAGATRANYGAVPGTVERTHTEPDFSEEIEDFPAGTRSDYEARKAGGDD